MVLLSVETPVEDKQQLELTQAHLENNLKVIYHSISIHLKPNLLWGDCICASCRVGVEGRFEKPWWELSAACWEQEGRREGLECPWDPQALSADTSLD